MSTQIKYQRLSLELQKQDCQRELDQLHKELGELRMQCEHANRTEEKVVNGWTWLSICDDCGQVFNVADHGGES